MSKTPRRQDKIQQIDPENAFADTWRGVPESARDGPFSIELSAEPDILKSANFSAGAFSCELLSHRC
jgi:hypothetical protein